MRQIAATANIFQAPANFTNRLNGDVDIRRIGLCKEIPDASIRARTLACLTDDVGIDQEHATLSIPEIEVGIFTHVGHAG